MVVIDGWIAGRMREIQSVIDEPYQPLVDDDGTAARHRNSGHGTKECQSGNTYAEEQPYDNNHCPKSLAWQAGRTTLRSDQRIAAAIV
ncbi:hypothetical protein [Cupriavidus pauculus]|uniref:hypothetical protein n=1 Tax=Cupriavidus pauculus TaxID=82633 RepID=UPI001247A059|nr:hypothetical protein [Cupriavidus pauculus]KAB0601028.1 hypothetical protein F7R19_18300 [Cupriavidus pauculus]UAL01958.1 hypothetical protein K8O84_24395 [Cupriavidus pauculus]